MRAFLSHSSKDKGFVEAVANLLKPGTFELDSETFDAGLINSEAIRKALERSDLFCLFLSERSVESSYVEYETLLGKELFARGRIKRFLVICLDETAFEKASDNVRYLNIVRKSLSEESTARLITGSLISAIGDHTVHPFIGREAPLLELEKQTTDPNRPETKAMYISGNLGAGRRTLAEKFYQNQYPRTGRIFPTVILDDFSGLAEIHRKLLTSIRPSMRSRELIARISAFDASTPAEQTKQLADLINSLLPANEALLMLDNGGLLTDSGAFEPEIANIFDFFRNATASATRHHC